MYTFTDKADFHFYVRCFHVEGLFCWYPRHRHATSWHALCQYFPWLPHTYQHLDHNMISLDQISGINIYGINKYYSNISGFSCREHKHQGIRTERSIVVSARFFLLIGFSSVMLLISAGKPLLAGEKCRRPYLGRDSRTRLWLVGGSTALWREPCLAVSWRVESCTTIDTYAASVVSNRDRLAWYAAWSWHGKHNLTFLHHTHPQNNVITGCKTFASLAQKYFLFTNAFKRRSASSSSS